MIILDTNVLSELMRVQPIQNVLSWLDQQNTDQLFLTAITVAEILYGIVRMPERKRKDNLRNKTMEMFDKDFFGQILVFDEKAATHYAEFAVVREQKGNPISTEDAKIAAICKSYDAILATRNIKNFVGLNLNLINPWSAT